LLENAMAGIDSPYPSNQIGVIFRVARLHAFA